MYFITIICGSLRIMAELSFWGCENLASNNTLGLSAEVAVPFIALYSIFVLSTHIFLDLSGIYLTFHFHVDTYFIVNPIIRTCLTDNPLNLSSRVTSFSLMSKSLFCHGFFAFVRKQSMMAQTILSLSGISFIICLFLCSQKLPSTAKTSSTLCIYPSDFLAKCAYTLPPKLS